MPPIRTWHCTRPDLYAFRPPASTDPSARQGYYVDAETADEARRDVQAMFPTERIEVHSWESNAS